MKKSFLHYIIAIALTLFVATSFAAETPNTPYQTTIEPISLTLKSRVATSYGPSTDIAVINYTDNTIVVTNPTYNVLPTKTSARIKNDGWSGDTEIRLLGTNGLTFFDRYVSNHATVSVYVSAGQYVVNVTN